jgi:hypothetical protein
MSTEEISERIAANSAKLPDCQSLRATAKRFRRLR